MTRTAWSACRPWTSSEKHGGDWLRGVFEELTLAVKRGRPEGPEVLFRLFVVVDNHLQEELVELRAVCGPDDDGSPCVTVMLLGED